MCSKSMLLKHTSHTVLLSKRHKGTLESSLVGKFVMECGVEKNNSKLKGKERIK